MLLGLVFASLGLVVLASLSLRAAEPVPAGSSAVALADSPGQQAGNGSSTTTAAAAEEPITLPEGWPEGLPLPTEKTNCVRCHLKAGRELSFAVMDFAHSVHDLNGMSCNDCHGGDTENDALAHDEEAGFIGTKLSAHLENCANCHDEPHEALAAGPHGWDFSKRINLDYPMCIDCHGNHDIGNPPEDFRLKDVCLDCHEQLDDEMPLVAGIIEQNDKFWATMIEVRQARMAQEEPVPPEFQERVDTLRHRTMHLIHRLGEIPQKKAEALNAQSEALRRELEKWLATAAADAPGAN